MENWIPKYIPTVHEKRAGEKVKNIDWNDSFNTLVSQGNWNSEAIDDLIELGNLTVQRSLYSEDSGLLGGQPSSYYAPRSKVLGVDENTYKPGSSWLPTSPEQPANKKYVDIVKTYMEGLFQDYTVKYSTGVTIKGVYDDMVSFLASHPSGVMGESYVVNDRIITWDPKANGWYDAGPIRGEKGDPGDIGVGLVTGGAAGSMLIKHSNSDYDYGFSDFTYDKVVTSDTTRKITVSGDEPVNPRDGDLWVKL